MNWLIRDKTFTYFCNKFRLVNHMCYTKCGVNGSFVNNSGCCTLDHCFITTHSIHKEGDMLQIYFCVIFCETGTMNRPKSHLAHCVPFLWLREHRQQCSWVDDFVGQCLWRHLLRLAAAAAVVVVPLLLLLLPQIILHHR